MGSLFQYALICAFLSISIFPVSQGLDCFHCIYQKNIPGGITIPGHPSRDKCEKKVPDDLKGVCTHPQVPTNIFPGQNNSSTINAETGDTCVKVHAKWDGGEFIFRGCIPKSLVTDVDPSKLGTCTSGNLKDLGDRYNFSLEGIAANLINIEGACFCDGDGCNSAVSVKTTWWMMALVGLGGILVNI